MIILPTHCWSLLAPCLPEKDELLSFALYAATTMIACFGTLHGFVSLPRSASHVGGVIWQAISSHISGLCLQLACLVMSVISAILQLPECSKNIKLALGSLQEVDYTLKNIHAKIRFLPGTWERKVALSSCTEGVSSF